MILTSIFLFLLLCYHYKCENFYDLSYNEIQNRSNDLKILNFVHVESAHDRYQIPFSSMGPISCSPNILRVSYFETLDEDIQRPQLFISGEIHGDERVGPQATLVLVEMLAHATNCELSSSAKSCAIVNDHFKLTASETRWLAFLATTRYIIAVPTANCLGYMQNSRLDNRIDPNRDFSYSRNDGACLRSTTARIIYQIINHNLIQLVVTFHGGMVALGYEWGSRNHPSPRDASPDNNAYADLAMQMRSFAGTFSGEKLYPVGPINSLIYPVDGGMEDWVYAAGWDAKPNKNCEGVQIGNKKPDPRSLVFLVETSDSKKPANEKLGSPQEILNPNSKNNGHIPRNVRLALTAIDNVQPYVCISDISIQSSSSIAWSSVNSSFHFSNQPRMMTETSSRSGSIRKKSLHRKIDDSPKAVKYIHLLLSWFIGGSISVDDTMVTLEQCRKPNCDIKNFRKSIPNWSKYLEEVSIPSSIQPNFTPVMNQTDYNVTTQFNSTANVTFLNNDPNSPLRRLREKRNHLSNPFPQHKKSRPRGGKFQHNPQQRHQKKRNLLRVKRALYENITVKKVFDESKNLNSAMDDPLVITNVFSGPALKNSNIPGIDILNSRSIFSDSVKLGSFLSDGMLTKTAWLDTNDEKGILVLPYGFYRIIIWARVDQNWGDLDQGEPKGGPQSFLVRARTDPNFARSENDRVVKGREFWPSAPILIQSGPMGLEVLSSFLECAWWNITLYSNNQPVRGQEVDDFKDPINAQQSWNSEPQINTSINGSLDGSANEETLIEQEEEVNFMVKMNSFFWNWKSIFAVILLSLGVLHFCRKSRMAGRLKRHNREIIEIGPRLERFRNLAQRGF